ncbi:MAG: prepilin-type N-terminal cleavage/methylation domain-containing protein [Candidatus Gastranaerophilaceae bacterium]
MENIAEFYPHGDRLRRAFTLAEVLIILGIIGIIASMVLPNAIQNVQDFTFRNQWKKAYRLFNSCIKWLMTIRLIHLGSFRNRSSKLW